MSSESLAGRVAHLDLAGINLDEAAAADLSEHQVWLRGGSPESLTAVEDRASFLWLADFVRSYLERDIPMFAPRLPAETLCRPWTMLAHTSGGLFNASRPATGLVIWSPTVDRFVNLLCDLGPVRQLEAWHVNTVKRMTRAPRVFVRDTGLLHTLLEISTMDQLLGHPSVGRNFESARQRRSWAPVSTARWRIWRVERAYVVHADTGSDAYGVRPGVTAIGLSTLVRRLRAESLIGLSARDAHRFLTQSGAGPATPEGWPVPGWRRSASRARWGATGMRVRWARTPRPTGCPAAGRSRG